MVSCMKTTLNLDDRLLRDAKKLAAETGRTLTSVVEAALRDALAAARRPPPRSLDIPVVTGRRLPDVDPSDRVALYERMADRR
jgi:hypothetical protein